ncbi:hypothetical protein DENSPDRAFT_923507, partial [Dentipellis sp. KUC8613]
PISLGDDVECSEFEALLCVLYPTEFHECELKTLDAWTSVLHLATTWSFSSLRALAIDRLWPIASPVDKVVLGRTYGVDAWIRPGIIALCDRVEPLTKAEGFRLGVGDAVAIMAIRERMRVRRADVSIRVVEVMVDDALKPEYHDDPEEPVQKTDGAAQGTRLKKTGSMAGLKGEKTEETAKGKDRAIDSVPEPIDPKAVIPMQASSSSAAAGLVNAGRAEPVQVEIKHTECPLPRAEDPSSITPSSLAEQPASPTTAASLSIPPDRPSCAVNRSPSASDNPWKMRPAETLLALNADVSPDSSKDTTHTAFDSSVAKSNQSDPRGFAATDAGRRDGDGAVSRDQDPASGRAKEYGKVDDGLQSTPKSSFEAGSVSEWMTAAQKNRAKKMARMEAARRAAIEGQL